MEATSGHGAPVGGCGVRSGSSVFVTVSGAERNVRVWQVSTSRGSGGDDDRGKGRPLPQVARLTDAVKANKEALLACAITPDGRRLASCASDGSVYVFKRPETTAEAEAKARARKEKEERRKREAQIRAQRAFEERERNAMRKEEERQRWIEDINRELKRQADAARPIQALVRGIFARREC